MRVNYSKVVMHALHFSSLRGFRRYHSRMLKTMPLSLKERHSVLQSLRGPNAPPWAQDAEDWLVLSYRDDTAIKPAYIDPLRYVLSLIS